jgi:Fe2+ transport system protein FeoA
MHKKKSKRGIKPKNGISKAKRPMLLAHVKPGMKYRIEAIYGGYCLNSRLHAMGILPGETVKVIHRTGVGPMTLAVKGVRIALGRGIAHKIEVSEV